MGSVVPSGIMEIAEIVGAVTVAVVDCETLLSVAVMVAEPAATPVSAPVAFTVATSMGEEFHVTRKVKSALLPSL